MGKRSASSNCYPRVEKIEVTVKDAKPEPNDVVLLMNKNMSTPFNCAQHIHEMYTVRSVVAEIDDNVLWDMHRPLETNCTLRFRHFIEDDPTAINKIFWRSCSFIMGMAIEKSFKSTIPCFLHSWPPANIKSGSFVYDVSLPSLENWAPTDPELLTLTSVFWKIKEKKINFERLSVKPSVAKDLFADNHFKSSQIDNMALTSDLITLYRLEDHIDISSGPLISNTGQVGRASITAVHSRETNSGSLYRFQGVAIPSELRVNHFVYKLFMDRSKIENRTEFMTYTRKPALSGSDVREAPKTSGIARSMSP